MYRREEVIVLDDPQTLPEHRGESEADLPSLHIWTVQRLQPVLVLSIPPRRRLISVSSVHPECARDEGVILFCQLVPHSGCYWGDHALSLPKYLVRGLRKKEMVTVFPQSAGTSGMENLKSNGKAG